MRLCCCSALTGFHLVYTTGLRVFFFVAPLIPRCHERDKRVEIYTTPFEFFFFFSAQRSTRRISEQNQEKIFYIILLVFTCGFLNLKCAIERSREEKKKILFFFFWTCVITCRWCVLPNGVFIPRRAERRRRRETTVSSSVNSNDRTSS